MCAPVHSCFRCIRPAVAVILLTPQGRRRGIRMRWEGDRSNIEDDRADSGGGSGFGAVHLGIGGFLVVLVLSWLSGTNLFSLFDAATGPPSQSVGTSGQVRSTPQEERMVDFVGAVAKDVQDTWAQLLGERYQSTRVALF